VGPTDVTLVTRSSGENPEPVTVADSATTLEDTTVVVAVLANDSDPDQDPLVLSSVSAPAHGRVVANADGTISYTPDADYAGIDRSTYTIRDGRGGSATTEVVVTITPVNDLPTFSKNLGLTLNKGAESAIKADRLAAGDVDNPAAEVTFTLTEVPSRG